MHLWVAVFLRVRRVVASGGYARVGRVGAYVARGVHEQERCAWWDR